MSLNYLIEKRGNSLLVCIKEKGSKRVLYLDRLKRCALPADLEPLSLLIKIHLKSKTNTDTLDFDRVIVPPSHVKQALELMRKTGRMIGEIEAKVEKPLVLAPRLVLKDSSGSFADLWMNYGELIEIDDFSPTVCGKTRLKSQELRFEKDLLDAGFQKKQVGNSRYFCPKEEVREALLLLLEIGWEVRDFQGNLVEKEVAIQVEGERIAIRAKSRALIDIKLQMEGIFEGETLYLKRNQIGMTTDLLSQVHINWDEQLFKMAEGLNSDASLKSSPPGEDFQGTLLPFQQKGVDWLVFLYEWGFSALLADEMGLGKTVQVLAFLSRIRTNLPILIVAPTSLLFNWEQEIRRFLPSRKDIVLLSYTSLRLKGEEIARENYEVIVFDESSAIKTRSTLTAKAAYRLKGKFKICLNGTPMENCFDEICSQFQFLMPDLIERNIQTLKNQIKPFILRRKKEDVEIDLPEKREQIVWVEMTEEQTALYKTVKSGFQIDGATQIEVLEMILKLRQISIDPRLVGSNLEGAKLERVIADVKEALQEGRKILVYSQFTEVLKLLRKEFEEAYYLDGSMPAAKRGEVVQAFQEDPNPALFLLSMKAGGVGLNLTAADSVLIIDPWWNEAVEKQAIDRAHRIGQKKKVLAKRYLSAHSIEEKILQLKAAKLKAATELLEFDGGVFDEKTIRDLLTAP